MTLYMEKLETIELQMIRGANYIDGGEGDDYLESRSLSGNHTLIGGQGNDQLSATGEIAFVDGGEGYDNLIYMDMYIMEGIILI